MSRPKAVKSHMGTNWVTQWAGLTRLQTSTLQELAARKSATVFPSDRLGRWTITMASGAIVVDAVTGESDFTSESAIRILRQHPDTGG